MSINVKYRNIIFAFLMALSMSFFVSFVLVSLNFGYGDTFLHIWLRMWLEAFICAFFGAYFFPRVIQKIMRKINFVEKPLIENNFLERDQTER